MRSRPFRALSTEWPQVLGASRSVAVVLGWLLVEEGMPLIQAWALVKGRHKIARPNRSFAIELLELDREQALLAPRAATQPNASLAMFGYDAA